MNTMSIIPHKIGKVASHIFTEQTKQVIFHAAKNALNQIAQFFGMIFTTCLQYKVTIGLIGGGLITCLFLLYIYNSRIGKHVPAPPKEIVLQTLKRRESFSEETDPEETTSSSKPKLTTNQTKKGSLTLNLERRRHLPTFSLASKDKASCSASSTDSEPELTVYQAQDDSFSTNPKEADDADDLDLQEEIYNTPPTSPTSHFSKTQRRSCPTPPPSKKTSSSISPPKSPRPWEKLTEQECNALNFIMEKLPQGIIPVLLAKPPLLKEQSVLANAHPFATTLYFLKNFSRSMRSSNFFTTILGKTKHLNRIRTVYKEEFCKGLRAAQENDKINLDIIGKFANQISPLLKDSPKETIINLCKQQDWGNLYRLLEGSDLKNRKRKNND